MKMEQKAEKVACVYVFGDWEHKAKGFTLYSFKTLTMVLEALLSEGVYISTYIF